MHRNIPAPHFTNLYIEDPLADAFWSYWLGESHFPDLRDRFLKMGEIGALATPLSARADLFSPILTNYTPTGERVDRVEYHPDYQRLREWAYGAGIVALKYDKGFLESHREVRHLAGFAIGYYFAQSEMSLYCPICMTDGLGRVLERHGKTDITRLSIERISSVDPGRLWEGAMFLTEMQGGSDVGANTASARFDGKNWLISGDKWFCSNVDAKAILVLARMPEAAAEGTSGLGLFLVLREKPHGNHQRLRINRIKEKLGVRSMATGEVEMVEAIGYLIGGKGEGFKQMAEMLNMSRLYNSVASVAALRRAILEALAYGRQREAFGKPLIQQPLWRAVMSDIVAEHLAALSLVFATTQYLDRGDGGDASAQIMTRLLTPMAKAATGKLAVAGVSECMEAIGGNAYIEESILPRLLRDAQVLPIWEGTTNILSLDVARVLRKHPEAGGLFYAEAARALDASRNHADPQLIKRVEELLEGEKRTFNSMAAANKMEERFLRSWLERSARVLSLAKLLASASSPGLKAVTEAAVRRLLSRAALTATFGSVTDADLTPTEEILLSSGSRDGR